MLMKLLLSSLAQHGRIEDYDVLRWDIVTTMWDTCEKSLRVFHDRFV